jgi:hypothetical protein
MLTRRILHRRDHGQVLLETELNRNNGWKYITPTALDNMQQQHATNRAHTQSKRAMSDGEPAVHKDHTPGVEKHKTQPRSQPMQRDNNDTQDHETHVFVPLTAQHGSVDKAKEDPPRAVQHKRHPPTNNDEHRTDQQLGDQDEIFSNEKADSTKSESVDKRTTDTKVSPRRLKKNAYT